MAKVKKTLTKVAQTSKKEKLKGQVFIDLRLFN
jgi:hypothetical protein